MIAALKAVFDTNPALAWVFTLGLLAIVAFLAAALKEAVLALVTTKQAAIEKNIVRADTAITQNLERSDAAIQRLETATTRAIDELREAQNTVTASFNLAVRDLQGAIKGMSEMMNQATAALHEKVNTTNSQIAEIRVDTTRRVTTLEADLRAHIKQCDQCARACPHRNPALGSPCTTPKDRGDGGQ